jgi:hypothetical protein
VCLRAFLRSCSIGPASARGQCSACVPFITAPWCSQCSQTSADKRALESPTVIAYKLAVGTRSREGQKWRLFELEGERDLANALACLDKAYKMAGSTRK